MHTKNSYPTFLLLHFPKLKSALTYAALGSSLVINGCGSSSKNEDKKEEAAQVTPPKPTTPSQTGTGTGTEPAPVNPAPPVSSDPSLGKDAKIAPAVATPELFSQIKEGAHVNTTSADKTRLLTKESQRCRAPNTTLTKPGTNYLNINPNIDSSQLVTSYRSKHHFINLVDACRLDLGLAFSGGHFMRLENLIALENCSRNVEIQRIADVATRSQAREILMMENLTLLCRLKQDDLSPIVQNILASSFVGSWNDIGK